jgi:hypothetical protein
VADVSLPLARERAEPLRTEAAERFLSPARIVGIALFVLFAATFDAPAVKDDGFIYFDFVRKLFGVDAPAIAYQFGSAFLTAPFYLGSRLIAARGELGAYHAAEVATAVAANVAVIIALYFGWRILRELGLPRGPVVLLLTLFGTPLFNGGALSPVGKHAADTAYATAMFWFAWRSQQPDARRRDYVALGVCFGLLLATRYANIAFVLGVLGVFAVLRLRSAIVWAAATTVAVCVLLFGLPVVRHIPYSSPPAQYRALPAAVDGPAPPSLFTQRLALPRVPIINPVLQHTNFDPTVPFKMLFTLHRGLFIWTPLTIFSTIGFVMLVRRDRRHRPFLAVLGVASAALLAIHAFWATQWDGGGTFSQRFLTALFPFFLVGTAAFIRFVGALSIPLLAVCVGWSLWIALVQYNGYYDKSSHDSVVQIVKVYSVDHYRNAPSLYTMTRLRHELGDRITDRWQLYWSLVS